MCLPHRAGLRVEAVVVLILLLQDLADHSEPSSPELMAIWRAGKESALRTRLPSTARPRIRRIWVRSVCRPCRPEQHLREVLKSYASYYNTARKHRSLAKDAPFTRPVHELIGLRVNDGTLVEVVRGRETILEFLFGGDADVAQHGAREFGKEALDEVERGAVLGEKVNSKRCVG
jgi:hypothetical protein